MAFNHASIALRLFFDFIQILNGDVSVRYQLRPLYLNMCVAMVQRVLILFKNFNCPVMIIAFWL
jgi:hypothetical protein